MEEKTVFWLKNFKASWAGQKETVWQQAQADKAICLRSHRRSVVELGVELTISDFQYESPNK